MPLPDNKNLNGLLAHLSVSRDLTEHLESKYFTWIKKENTLTVLQYTRLKLWKVNLFVCFFRPGVKRSHLIKFCRLFLKKYPTV